MNRTLIASALLLSAMAAGAQTFNDNARVRSVQPQYETVQVPREECSSQYVTEQPAAAGVGANGYGGVILGGVVGGLLGNQVGKGHGREAATAAGAVVGAVAGDRIANQGAVAGPAQTREVRSCRTVYEQQNRITGYRVTYEYRGTEGATVTRTEPGATLPVRVSITPLDVR